MRTTKKIGITVLLFLFSKTVFPQQLRLGKNPYAVEKSAVLELMSDNQGLLLPRITDTSLINALSPPDGMVIFYTPNKQLLLRSNGYWQNFAIAGSGVTSLNGNTGVLIMDTSYINNFYLKVRSLHSATAPVTYNSTTGAIGITQATTSTNGYLSSTDWNTFNNKLSSVDTSNISGFYLKVRGLFSAGTGISYNNTTGVITNVGVTSLNGNTGSLTMDTSYISNFYLKVRGLFSATAPVTYNSTTGAVGITQATTSTNGYLSSTDWNTFNNKQGSGNYLSDPGGNGVVVRTSLNTTTSRTLTGTANRITITNGSGTGGNPTFDVGSNIIDKTVSNTYTGGAKQTFVNSASTAGFNLTASADPSTPASGDFWNSTTTANSLKYRDAGATTRTLVDLSLSQTLTNKSISGSTNTLTNIPNSALTNSSITVATGTTGTDVGVTGSPVSLGGTVTLNIPIASGTNTGKLSSTDWTTFNNKLSSVDTSNILNFYLKVRGLFSATAPVTYNSTTGAIGISQATTSTNGYLSSTDWNTFNNKQSSGNYMTDPGGNGVVVRTALNTTINRTITGTANRITLTNGDGVSSNPTIDVGSNIVDKTVANTYTGGAKQTFVNSATTAGFNLTASTDPSTPASGDLWNSTTTANSLKYRDAASTTRTLVDLSLTQTLTNKTLDNTNTVTLKDANFTLQDNAATTKQMQFQLSAITAGQTRTISIPDANTTMVGTDATQTLTNKTITSSTNILGGVTMTLGTDATGDLYYRNSSGILTRLPIGSAGDHLITVNGLPSWTSPSTYQATPADPATTTSTTGRMMGLAGSVTPAFSGTIMITISGDMDNNTANDGTQVQIRYGTGTAPTNAAFLTGTTAGSLIKMVSSSATNRIPFNCNAIVSGLNVGTVYWIDVGLAAITGGTARVRDISISVTEL